METAYVLVSCDHGSEKAVIEDLKHIESVREVNGTFGAYDIFQTRITNGKMIISYYQQPQQKSCNKLNLDLRVK